MLFYASPILYVATHGARRRTSARTSCNPIAAVLTQMRHAVVDPSGAEPPRGDRRRRPAADPARDRRRRRSRSACGRSSARRRGWRRTYERADRRRARPSSRRCARASPSSSASAPSRSRAANAAVAAAQERAYWLDRWHLDLNALMARRGAAEFRAAVRLARGAIRARPAGQAPPARMSPSFSVVDPRPRRGALPRGAARRACARRARDVEVLVIDSGSTRRLAGHRARRRRRACSRSRARSSATAARATSAAERTRGRADLLPHAGRDAAAGLARRLRGGVRARRPTSAPRSARTCRARTRR